MIYELTHDYENTYLLLLDGVELYTKMPTFRPTFKAKPRLEDWVAPSATFFKSENYTGTSEVLPDITNWSTGVLALNLKAYDVFYDYLSACGEFLPITVNNEKFYLFNTLYVIPDSEIDMKNAVEVIDSRVHMGQSNVNYNENYLNNEDRLIFKTRSDKLFSSYCTDVFKALYEANNFKGLVFKALEIK
ncbi:MAG: hypothetical protein B0W54_20215 [Cellvibrio sp. 79]|nr:MAG: hypothetical protein B0W54_20215 [Cellvibrio sp. 79]